MTMIHNKAWLGAAFTLLVALCIVPAQAQPGEGLHKTGAHKPAKDQGQVFDTSLQAALKSAVSDSQSFEDRFAAEVWLLDMSGRLMRFMPNVKDRLDFLRSVHREARRANLPPELVLAIIEVESRFDRFAVSRAGAQGYMQVMSFWVKEIGRPEDNLLTRDTNLRYGCTILRHYLDIERNNVVDALGRYNGSLGRFEYPNLVMNALSRRWFKG